MKKLVALTTLICIVAAGILTADIVYIKKSDSIQSKQETVSVSAVAAAVPTEDVSIELQNRQQKNKTIYLTFDDGPYKYTEKLLETLDATDVKVTFFVTNQNEDYANLIRDENEAGHSIGIHTASHVYKDIYSSTELFYKDFYEMQQIVFEQTGRYSNLYRFPGGSSNTVSKKYAKGLVSDIAKDLQNRGYSYVDWNVNSGDTEGLNTAEEVFEKTIDEIQKLDSDDAIVLLHDIHEWTVDAVPMIINWGKENQCTFAALSNDSPQMHFDIAN